MKNLKIQLVFVGVMLSTFFVAAQAPGNPGSGPVGGIVYLLLAALGFAVYKLRRSNKN